MIEKIIQLMYETAEKSKHTLSEQELETIKEATKDTLEETVQKGGKPGSAVIADDIILFAKNTTLLLTYFINVLSVLLYYRVTVKLWKTRFIPTRAEFIGVDVLHTGNALAKAKYEPIEKLERPKLFSDLRMLIGLMGFYQKWLPLYETRIG